MSGGGGEAVERLVEGDERRGGERR
jgi:hypothetical protein